MQNLPTVIPEGEIDRCGGTVEGGQGERWENLPTVTLGRFLRPDSHLGIFEVFHYGLANH